MKQSEAVVIFVKEITDVSGKVQLTSDQRKQVVERIVAGIKEGTISFSESARAKHDTDAKLRSYVGGMVTNWLNKNPELNGGVKYVAKNPGSRSGSLEYKQALALKSKLQSEGQDVPADLETFIAQNAPAPKGPKLVKVDTSSLPEALKALAG